MEKRKAILVVVLVLYLHFWPQADGRIRAIGCSFYKKLCKPGEDCDKEDSYPFGKCKRYQLKHQKDSTNRKYWRDEVGEIEDRGRTLAKAFSTEKEQRREVKDGSEGRYYQNSKYDMTYFENDNSFNQIPHEERKAVGYEKLSSPNSVRENLGEGYRRQQDVEESGHYGRRDSLHHLKHEQTLNLERYEDDSGPLRGSTVDFPKEHSMHHQLEESGNSKFNIVEVTNEKRTTKSDNEYQNPENDNSLDLDVEIKPLSLSDSKYFEEKKAKHSSIPKTPSLDNKNLEKLEHIQADILDKIPAKKTKVNVLVGGRLNRAETGTVREKNPDRTYDKIKDFFKSQQVSSLVDAPVAEKKQSVKLYSSVPENKDVNVRRSSIPTSSVYPVRIRLDVKQRISLDQARNLLNTLQDLLWGPNTREAAFTSLKTEDKVIFFHMLNNTTTSDEDPSSVVDRINYDKSLQNALMKASGITVVSASVQDEEQQQVKEDSDFMVTTLIVAGCVTGILLASVCIFIILKRSQDNSKWVPKQAGKEAASDYQSLWRQLRQATWEAPIHTPSVAHADNGDQKGYFGNKGMPPRYSWSEEPVDTKMDVSTGHVVLAYMEDHLKNENRLSKEWEDLSVYEAEPDLTDVGKDPTNSKKNRYSDVLPYDHNRVKLRETSNASGCDYINASYIIDDDPRNPAYIATQGPLGNTVADFWQMVWEQGVVVIVMLTKLADLGLPQCHRYWPEKGREVYHIYQVHLISEHIWCSDYLVRSFYLKNVQTGETRTVTQFHFLTWPHLGIPVSSKPLLDFRRKVLKCYRSHSSPIVVHCSGGIDRTGTYILIDMVLSKMSRGTKEIDIAATLEHLRDQRPDMVKTKAQFEFALISVAEEVNAILQVLTKH